MKFSFIFLDQIMSTPWTSSYMKYLLHNNGRLFVFYGKKLLTKQEQTLRQELSLRISESLKQYENQMSETNHRLSWDRIRDEFHPFIDQCRLMANQNQKSVETLRSMIEQDRNFAKENFHRIDTNIAHLLKKDKENSSVTVSMNRSSSDHHQHRQQIHDMIDEERESLMKRLNELDEKIESFMQQIDSKLNRCYVKELKIVDLVILL